MKQILLFRRMIDLLFIIIYFFIMIFFVLFIAYVYLSRDG